jgi:NADH-quinone oxidoreductase subunit L
MDSMFTQYAWLIPVLPLLAFIVLLVLGKHSKMFGIYLSIIAIFASFVLSVFIFIERLGDKVSTYTWDAFNWIKIGTFEINLGFEITNLNALMLLVVTTVSLLVHIYSLGYMHDDERKSTFFSYIALFTFSMLGLVIAENIVQFFIFWELVGVCSFLLVGFWYFKPEAKAAAKKAFIVTRIGDLGLFIAIILLYTYMPGNALDFSTIQSVFTSPEQLKAIPEHIQWWIAILIFVGAIGKSGQFPLHTWLPDAMEGPTPISALIHAATMVAAGVYLVALTYDIFLASPGALEVVAYVGGFTAIFAAIIGLTQTDIKRILAYSTVSQLGYMMMALGFGSALALTAGMFHLFTHAFFKALLFLGAGSVIHAVHEQDIYKMGGLASKMKITTWTFAIGTLALSGIFPLSGFWSKDAILVEAIHHETILFVVGTIAALLTAFYMTRLYCLVFLGESKQKHAHESPFTMTLPLVVLSFLAIIAGFVYTPFFPWLGTWMTGENIEEHVNWTVIILSTVAAVSGIVLGYLFYGKKLFSAENVAKRISWLYRLSYRKFYIDELYQIIIVRPLKIISYLLDRFDYYVIDGAVRLTAQSAVWLGGVGARLQNGQLQIYALVTIFGFIILVLALIGRRFW